MTTEVLRIVQPADWKELADLAVDTLASPHSRAAYSAAIRQFLASGYPLDRSGVLAHLRALLDAGKGAPTRNVAIAAIRLLAREAFERQLIDIDVVASLEHIRTAKVSGSRTGNWLDLHALKLVLQAAGEHPHGVRNRAMVAVMAGCGLRRAEVVGLDWSQWQQREARWTWVDVKGKGNRIRTVPCPDWVASYVNEWKDQDEERKRII